MPLSNPQLQCRQSYTKYKAVLAYDFGTTYSGTAYAFTHGTTTDEVFDIQNWPDKGDNFYPKVPTLSVNPRHDNSQQQGGRDYPNGAMAPKRQC